VVMPLTGNNWTVPFERTDQPVAPGERPPDVGWQLASGGFFRALEIPLVGGRLFDERDTPASPPVVIVSEAVRRRFFGGEGAVGRTIRLGEETAEIVGVVGDIRRAGLDDEPRADMYFPFERAYGGGITLFIRSEGDPAEALGAMQAAIRGVEPNAAIANPRTLAEVASESVRITKLVLWLLATFAATALALAAVGVYGVMSYVVGQRTREIGTRMALGAVRSDIVRLVMRQGAVIAGIGTAMGLAIARDRFAADVPVWNALQAVKSHILNPNPLFAIFPPAMVTPSCVISRSKELRAPGNRRGPFFLGTHRSPA
jgi:putative ABC transport system permease protein